MIRWEDEAIVISSRKHGERQVISTALTKNHGRHKGIFRPSKTTKSLTECGTVVQAGWQARLSEHLGSWNFESLYTPLPFVLNTPLSLKALNAACALAEVCLPERDPAPKVYTALLHLVHEFENSASQSWLQAYCYFELFLLKQTGISLDFKSCAATGSVANLIYVSPRSGRAVSAEAGEPYKDKLLVLPAFLQQVDNQQKPLSFQEILAALALSGYFLSKYVLIPHDIEPPAARLRFCAALEKLGDNPLEVDEQKYANY